MKKPDDLALLGALVRRWCKTVGSYDLLDSASETRGSTWTAGGCAVLATALIRWSRGRMELAELRDEEVAHHYLASCDGWLIDADGCASSRVVARRWQGREFLASPKIVTVSAARVTPDGVVCPERLVKKVAARLDAALGKPQDYPSIMRKRTR